MTKQSRGSDAALDCFLGKASSHMTATWRTIKWNWYKMSDTAKLSAKFQISIPKAVREAHKWKAGQEFAFIPKGTGVLLAPVPERDALVGLARGAKPDDYRDRKDRY